MTPSHVPAPPEPPKKDDPKHHLPLGGALLNIAGLASGVALLIHGGHHKDPVAQTAGTSLLLAVAAVAFARQHRQKQD